MQHRTELRERVSARQVDPFTASWLVGKIKRGDPGRPPVTENWNQLYQPLLYDAQQGGYIDSKEMLDFLVEHWDIKVRIPERWPRDLPVTIQVFYETWTPAGLGVQQIEPTNSEFESLLEYDMLSDDEGRPWRAAQPTNCEISFWTRDGEVIVEWDALHQSRSERVTVWYQGDQPDKDEPAASKDIELNWSAPTPTPIDEILTPIVDPELDQLIRETVTAQVDMPPGRNVRDPFIRIDFTALEPYLLEHDGPTIGVAVDLLRDGEVQHRVRGWVWTTDALPATDAESQYVLTNLLITPGRDIPTVLAMPRLDFSSGEWTVRLRSDEIAALQNFNCTEYWVGEVTIPLEIPATMRAGGGVTEKPNQ